MDYDLENDNKGSGKGPFYGAVVFIFVTIAIFTSFSLQEQGSLDHWQIATLLLGYWAYCRTDIPASLFVRNCREI